MRTRVIVLCTVLTAAVAGCGGGSNASTEPHTLTVLAASSLTDTFTEVAKQFENQHPAVHVKLVFDSSATLAQQAEDHAPGDVLATADEQTMKAADDGGGLAGKPAQFASNVIELAVPQGNPAKVAGIRDLGRPDVDFLTCVRTAPCGSAAHALLQQDGVTRHPVSEEVDVRSVLAKLEAGEADAGLVYRTDVTASHGRVTGLPVPGADERPNTYWVSATADATGGGDLALQWIAFLLSPPGQAVLKAAGFGTVG